MEADPNFKYEDLNADTVEEGDKKYIERTRKLWNEFAVSGVGKDLLRSDPDGEAALGLFKLAGLDISNVQYMKPGEIVEGKINLDSGNVEGVKADGETLIVDHHSKVSKRGSSATKYAYKLLVEYGFLKKSPVLDKLVEFINHDDNRSYPNEREIFRDNMHRTVVGLVDKMSFNDLYVFFKDGRSPEEVLSEADLKKYHLEEASKEIKEKFVQSMDVIKKLERSGFAVDSKKYGKILVNMGQQIPLDHSFRAVKAAGYDGYVIYNPRLKTFFVSTLKPMQKNMFRQGDQIRETMWITKRGKGQKYDMTLKEILDALTGTDFKGEKALGRYLSESSSQALAA